MDSELLWDLNKKLMKSELSGKLFEELKRESLDIIRKAVHSDDADAALKAETMKAEWVRRGKGELWDEWFEKEYKRVKPDRSEEDQT